MKVPPSRWAVTRDPPADLVNLMSGSLNVPPVLSRLLVQRGYDSVERAKQFLRPTLDALSDPSSLPDMERAVELIADTVRSGDRILINGDYDVDGQCATALLTRTLRAAGADVVPFIPHRTRDGYDLGPAGVRAAAEAGVRLVITCDCGSRAHEAIDALRAAGRRVVVTDHHVPGALPQADAIVNPRRGDPDAPTYDLCGAGVAFKLAQALAPVLGLPAAFPFHLIDLAALATVADVVPLVQENRILVRHGLRKLVETRWPGLRALIDTVGLAGKEIRAGQVGFVLGPRLNAAGRIGDAMDGLALLLADDDEEARTRARQLETLNAQRQELDQRILDGALRMVDEEVDLDRDFGIVLARDDWHAGVIGIVASRLVERFARPAILVAIENETGKGSGRSIPSFDLHDALTACAPHLVRYGGHRMAAGLTIERSRLGPFREAFNAVAVDRLSADDLIPTQRVDAVVGLDAMDEPLERLLRHLEPCGMGNPGPVFGVRGARIRDPKAVGTNHLRFTLDDGGTRLAAIAFGWADRVEPSWSESPVDVAFRLDANEWRGTSTLQARVVQLRPSA